VYSRNFWRDRAKFDLEMQKILTAEQWFDMQGVIQKFYPVGVALGK
jgi:Spy/CpxP family protein refolding chaperone